MDKLHEILTGMNEKARVETNDPSVYVRVAMDPDGPACWVTQPVEANNYNAILGFSDCLDGAIERFNSGKVAARQSSIDMARRTLAAYGEA